MPTYQYECTSCEHQFELVQSFTDAPASACPECGMSVRKVFSNVGIVFKGSGFYKTDSRSSSSSTTSSTSSPTQTSTSPSATKSESTPSAPKSETPSK